MCTDDRQIDLVIGEDFSKNIPEEFHTVNLYSRNKDNSLMLVTTLSLPYLINYVKFLNIKDDPRYILKEGYDRKTGGCKYICEIKPLGDLRGVYRVLNGQNIKIMSIEHILKKKT